MARGAEALVVALKRRAQPQYIENVAKPFFNESDIEPAVVIGYRYETVISSGA